MTTPKRQTSANIYGDRPWHKAKPTDLWNTPPGLILKVEEAFGCPLFDPCPPNPQQDGLAIQWHGSVFVNGPYSFIDPWIEKGVAAMQEGHIDQISYLLKLDPTTKWWKILHLRLPVIYCLLGDRIKYTPQADIESTTAPFPSVMTYSGPRPERFIRVFKDVGQVVVAL